MCVHVCKMYRVGVSVCMCICVREARYRFAQQQDPSNLVTWPTGPQRHNDTISQDLHILQYLHRRSCKATNVGNPRITQLFRCPVFALLQGVFQAPRESQKLQVHRAVQVLVLQRGVRQVPRDAQAYFVLHQVQDPDRLHLLA